MTRVPARATLAAAVAALLVPAAAPAAPASQRVTIAVVGDSVIEGLSPAGPVSPGLTEQLTNALVAGGFKRGGAGFEATTPFRWTFDEWGTPLEGPPSPKRWLLTGGGGLPADDGPSGYAAISIGPARTAELHVRDQLVGILYTTAPVSTPFAVRSGNRAWLLDALAPGSPKPAIAWLGLSRGARELRLSGPVRGRFTLAGAIRRRTLPATGVQVEVSNLGHAGRASFEALGARSRRSFDRQRYDIVVFATSYLPEALSETSTAGRADDIARLYEADLQERAEHARANGSLCLIVDSSPMPVPAAVRSRFSAIHRRVARAAGCRWTRALRSVWGKRTPAEANRAGLVIDDDIHPTVKGYGVLSRALAPAVAVLVRQRAKHPAPAVAETLVPPTIG